MQVLNLSLAGSVRAAAIAIVMSASGSVRLVGAPERWRLLQNEQVRFLLNGAEALLLAAKGLEVRSSKFRPEAFLYLARLLRDRTVLYFAAQLLARSAVHRQVSQMGHLRAGAGPAQTGALLDAGRLRFRMRSNAIADLSSSNRNQPSPRSIRRTSGSFFALANSVDPIEPEFFAFPFRLQRGVSGAGSPSASGSSIRSALAAMTKETILAIVVSSVVIGAMPNIADHSSFCTAREMQGKIALNASPSSSPCS